MPYLEFKAADLISEGLGKHMSHVTGLLPFHLSPLLALCDE